MTWQATFGLVLYVGWVGMHSWLGKKRLLRTLAALIALDFLAFTGLMIWIRAESSSSPSAGAALVAIGGCAVLLVPAAVGGFSIWKHGTTRAL